jgi:predicted  nucleic acid-binding Zn-ribbon protein
MEADRWIERVTSQRNHLPEMTELATLEDELRALMAALQEAQGEMAPVKTAYDDARNEAERLRTREREIGATLGASTANARELTALQKELDHVRQLLGDAEDRELELLLALEPLEETVRAIRERAQPGVARRGTLQVEIKELQATLDDEIVALRSSRAEKATLVPAQVLATYDLALARVGTSGAANVDAGRCDGCRIALSPLDLDRWKQHPADSFFICPSCGRLLLP